MIGLYIITKNAVLTFVFLQSYKAPCNDIIQRATSIIDYDCRDGNKCRDGSSSMCPVLHALYKADEKKSDPRLCLTCKLFLEDFNFCVYRKTYVCYLMHAYLSQEAIVSDVFKRFGLRWHVELSHGPVGDVPDYPFVKVETLVKALDRSGKLYKFLGLGENVNKLSEARDYLKVFWQRFEVVYGSHEVFRLAREGVLQLSDCVPCFIHGDEGTTYKKDGCLVVSVHSPLGRGTLSNKLGAILDDLSTLEPHTNFAGHAFETRFLLGALLKDFCIEHNKLYYICMFFFLSL